MPGKEGETRPQGEFLFDPDSISIFSFPHLRRMLVIDARAGGGVQGTFFLDQKEIISQTKKAILDDFREALMRTPDDFPALLSLPGQLQALMFQHFSAAIVDHLPSEPTPLPGNPGVFRPSVTINVFNSSAESFWNRHRQTFIQKLAGRIDLIVDVRTRFEELIQEEKQSLFKGGDETPYTIWQSPSQN